MELFLLFGLQLLAIGAGFLLLLRRIDSLQQQVEQMRQALEGRRAVARPKVVSGNIAALRSDPDAPLSRAARAWRKPETPSPPLNARVLTLCIGGLALAPAGALLAGVQTIVAVGAGMGVGVLFLLAALRPNWRAAAWGGAGVACAWALAGHVLGAAQTHPGPYASYAALAAFAGLAFALMGGSGPGAGLVLAMGAAILVVGAQLGMIGAPGAAFGAIVAAAAIVGASRLRLEAIHIAAFCAALVGLFVLSGQAAAAIWFTPAAAWTGALFLAIAVVRVPQLGARGATLAGTGALAPFAAIAALHGAQHGLSNPFAAGGAFLSLALILGGVAWLAAERRHGGFADLKLTLWVLALGALTALFAAIVVSANAVIAAPLLMALAAGAIKLDRRLPSALWRVAAGACATLAGAYAWICAQRILSEALPAWPTLAAALVLPALLSLYAGHLARQRNLGGSAAALDVIGFALVLAALHLGVRLMFSAGAPLAEPVGLDEPSAHASIWLILAFAIGVRGGALNKALAGVFAIAGLCAAFVVAGLWLAAYLNAPAQALGHFNALVFAAPAGLLVAHWAFWRGKSAAVLTRLSLGGAALMAASAFTMEVLKARAGAGANDWISAVAGATAFALAIAINFAPGIVGAERPRWNASVSPQRSERRRSYVRS